MRERVLFCLFLCVFAACRVPAPIGDSPVDEGTAAYLRQFQPFNNILEFQFFAPGEPGCPAEDTFVLHFSQPMVTLDAVGDALNQPLVTVSPTLTGYFFWQTPRVLVFRAAKPLEPQTLYEVRVKAGYESLAGTALVRDAIFTFQKPDQDLSVSRAFFLPPENRLPESPSVNGPFQMTLEAPSLARVGDRFRARATIENFSSEATVFTGLWRAQGIASNCDLKRELKVVAGGSVTLVCEMVVTENSVRVAHLKTSLEGTVNGANVSFAISPEGEETVSPVMLRDERYYVATDSGVAAPSATVILERPEGADPTSGGLRLMVRDPSDHLPVLAKIFLNGERILMSSLDPVRRSDTLFLPTSKLPEVLELRAVGGMNAPLFYEFSLSAVLQSPPSQTLERGLALSRQVFGANGERTLAAFDVGDVYEVQLALFSDASANDVVIEEPLPCGFKIVADRGAPFAVSHGRATFRLHDVPRGLTRFSYFVVPQFTGECFWPRATARLLGGQNVTGTTAAGWVKVTTP